MTVIVVFQAVNVEPTVSLFLEASDAPMMATSALDVAENVVPDVSFSVPPPFAPPTSALPGLLVPMTRMGKTTFPGALEPPLALPPPNWPNWEPSAPALVGDVSVVFDDDSSSLRDSCSAVTWGREIKASIEDCVNGVPPPLKPKKPFGATVIVLPEDARTELIFELTASRAISIEIDRVMATAKITTTPIERMEFRNALRTPRRKEFTGLPFKFWLRHFVEPVEGGTQVWLSEG